MGIPSLRNVQPLLKTSRMSRPQQVARGLKDAAQNVKRVVAVPANAARRLVNGGGVPLIALSRHQKRVAARHPSECVQHAMQALELRDMVIAQTAEQNEELQSLAEEAVRELGEAGMIPMELVAAFTNAQGNARYMWAKGNDFITRLPINMNSRHRVLMLASIGQKWIDNDMAYGMKGFKVTPEAIEEWSKRLDPAAIV